MTKIKAIVRTEELWTVDDKGELKEYNKSWDADRGNKIIDYMCYECLEVFGGSWKLAKKHVCSEKLNKLAEKVSFIELGGK